MIINDAIQQSIHTSAQRTIAMPTELLNPENQSLTELKQPRGQNPCAVL